MALNVAYLTHNRSYYTGITLPRVVDECKRFGAKLHIFDDASTDDTLKMLDRIDFDFELIRGDYHNTVWQFNWMLERYKEGLMYYLGNDIILPEGVFSKLTDVMNRDPELCSVMIQETGGLPYMINDEMEYHTFTSSLGIHRLEAFAEIPTYKRYFGFQEGQRAAIERGYKVARMKGMGNTNLDMSPWGRQMEYEQAGYARSGLVSPQNNVWK